MTGVAVAVFFYVYEVDICAYGVMSNHYHVMLHVDENGALSWSDETALINLYGVC